MHLIADTQPAAELFLINGYRRMTTTAKLKIALEMSQAVVELAEAGIQKRYPGILQAESKKRLGAILWGREISIRVNQWDPEKEGY